MSTQYTPALGLAYCDSSTALVDLAATTQQLATTVEAALLTRGIATADVQQLVAAGWFTDTGWVKVPTRAGFTVQNAIDPAVRKLGKVVYMRWGWSSTGMAGSSVYTVADVPAGLRPALTSYFRLATPSATLTAEGVVYSDGRVEIRTGATVAGYMLFDGITWLTD